MIIRGTTPTLTFHVKDETINLNDFAVMYATFQTKPGVPNPKTKEYDIDDLTLDAENHNIEVYMTQEDTLTFINPNAECQLRGRMNNGKTYASQITDLSIGRIIKEGVI